MSISTLISSQNRDGGWPYVRGTSRTEPTVYAVMALLAAGETEPARRGRQWILALRRADGGWPPQAGVEQSTWLTALVALLPAEFLGPTVHAGAIRWLLGVAGEEASRTYRLRQWLLGNPTPPDQEFPGWPWIPGTASWVGPTSLAILALEREGALRPSAAIHRRVDGGRRFLLARECKGGGWNHGSVRTLGYELGPYPETTGMALTALRGIRSPQIDQALEMAGRFLATCRSADALNWLRLGLAAHSRSEEGNCPSTRPECHTLREVALGALVDQARQDGRPFWS